MLDPKGLEAAREQPGTNHEAIIRAYIDAIMPVRVSGLVERLRQYEGRSWETTHCYNGVRDEAAISIENLSAGLATVWRNKLEAEDALSSERAAHAETKRKLDDATDDLAEIGGCFTAAEAEGLIDLINGREFYDDSDIYGLVVRRLLPAGDIARRARTGGKE